MSAPSHPDPAAERVLAHLRLDRLQADLARYSAFGRLPQGGISRPALAPADMESRRALEADLRAAGLEVIVDAVANVFGRRSGRDPARRAVWLGSHLDTVPAGGPLDGPLGVLGALEVLRAIAEAGVLTEAPLEVVSFTGEEGSRFRKGTLGSKVAGGVLTLGEALAVTDKVTEMTFAEAMREAGYPEGLPERPARLFAEAYVELHIEQGKVLEETGTDIGVVTAICGLAQRRIHLRGEANHAGTTPMDRRRDALCAAAELVLAIERAARAVGGGAVGTAGNALVSPGGINVIPGEVAVLVDLRAPEAALLDALWARVGEEVAAIGLGRGVEVEDVFLQRVEPAPLDAGIADRVERAAGTLGLRSRRMPSGAIHDALLISRSVPAGMIFVPSKGGKSHTPEEDTRPEDLLAGLRVLALTALDLAGIASAG